MSVSKAWAGVELQAGSAFDEDCETLVLEAIHHLVDEVIKSLTPLPAAHPPCACGGKEPLAAFNWLLQRDEDGDWCLEWVRPGDEFDGDEEIPIHVIVLEEKPDDA